MRALLRRRQARRNLLSRAARARALGSDTDDDDEDEDDEDDDYNDDDGDEEEGEDEEEEEDEEEKEEDEEEKEGDEFVDGDDDVVIIETQRPPSSHQQHPHTQQSAAPVAAAGAAAAGARSVTTDAYPRIVPVHQDRPIEVDCFADSECIACLDQPMRSPRFGPCGHSICSDCYNRLTKKECPRCKGPFAKTRAFDNLQSKWNKLELRCTGCPDAGGFVGTDAAIAHREKTCPRACPRGCNDDKRFLVGADDAKHHDKFECERRAIVCKACDYDKQPIPVREFAAHVRDKHTRAEAVLVEPLTDGSAPSDGIQEPRGRPPGLHWTSVSANNFTDVPEPRVIVIAFRARPPGRAEYDDFVQFWYRDACWRLAHEIPRYLEIESHFGLSDYPSSARDGMGSVTEVIRQKYGELLGAINSNYIKKILFNRVAYVGDVGSDNDR